MKKIFYWSPFLDNIGTINSTFNSAVGMNNYFKNQYQITIINVCGEWSFSKTKLLENNIKIIDLRKNYLRFLPKKGFIPSRFSSLIIFLLSWLPLKKIINREKPDFFVMHLLTSLPLILMLINNFETKFILRISGLPKLNLLRKFLWRSCSKKLKLILFPSEDSLSDFKNKNIFDEKKMFCLKDPFINLKNFLVKKTHKHNFSNKNYFISVGRLTKQKNFEYLINEFKKFNLLNNKYSLLIFGEGEEKNKLKLLIKKYQLENKVFLMGFSENIYSFMRDAEALILTSLWEDPGSVLMEAAISNLFIISSDCKNGPREFLNDGSAGTLFPSNEINALSDSLSKFINEKNNYKKKILAKKNSKNYTIFRHSINFDKILSRIS